MFKFDPSSFVVAANTGLACSLLFYPIVVGLCIYIAAFYSQSVKRRLFGQSMYKHVCCKESELRGVQHTHMSLSALLLYDAFTAISITLVVALGFSGACQIQDSSLLVCLIPALVWVTIRKLSLSQHLTTTLVCVLFLYRPQHANRYRLVGKGLLLTPFALIMVAICLFPGVVVALDIFNLVLMVSITVVCLMPAQSRMANQRRLLGVLAAVTFVLVCLPNAVLNCLLIKSPAFIAPAADVFVLTNFYFILDALMFYLILKINVEEEEEGEPRNEAAMRLNEEKPRMNYKNGTNGEDGAWM